MQNNSQTILYYQDAVLQELASIKTIPSSLIESGGLKIYTTQKTDIQQALEEEIVKETTLSSLETADNP